MNTKNKFFSQGGKKGAGKPSQSPLGDLIFGDDTMYTGHPAEEEPDVASGPVLDESRYFSSPHAPRGNPKGHAAYAAQEKIPPENDSRKRFGTFGAEDADHQSQQGAGFGPGMNTGFTPMGGLFAKESGPAHSTGEDDSDLLSILPQDRLEEECAKRVCPSCPAKKEQEDIHLRAMAELENTRKRLVREQEEHSRFAAEKVLNDILPSLDNLDLALQHAGKDEACKNFVIGVQMTRKLMGDALAKHGLSQVGAVGEEFDPAKHEAVGMMDSQDVPDGCICSMLASGYMLNGRLLRPARVMVCKK